jgi:glycosyltransferase involved in cell wall biosynthesis
MPEKKKSLLLLTPGFPENESDSTCLPWFQCFVRQLKISCPDLKIIVVSLQYPFQKKEYQWEGIRVYALGGRNSSGIARLLLRYKVHQLLKRLSEEESIIGIVSLWYGEAARAGEKISATCQLPHFCWIAGQDAKAGNPYPSRLKIPGERLIAVSDFIQEQFWKAYGISPAHVIPFGPDQRLYQSPAPDKDIDLLAAGSLIPLKQFGIFLDVVHAVQQRNPSVKAVLCGSGPEAAALKQKAEGMGLNKNLLFTGETPYPELLDYMQRAKILLHPSAYEGFGCVCTEALLGGAYVIRFTQPMKKNMQNSITVPSKEEMIYQSLELLEDYTVPQPVNEYPVEAMTEKLIDLFGFQSSGNLQKAGSNGSGRHFIAEESLTRS